MNDAPFMLGVAARLSSLTERDLELIQGAGIGWLRFGEFGLDQAAFFQNAPQGEAFQAAKQQVRRMRERGLQLLGITPGPKEMHRSAGKPGSAEYHHNYGRLCAFLATEFAEDIEWWQVANELDIWIFRDTLTMDQSVEFLKAGIRGMKAAVPTVKLGINLTLFPSLPGEVDGNTDAHEGLILACGIYGDPELMVDYAGFDSYPGTWRKGGPECWHDYLHAFHRLTGKPVLIQEFGYASAGDMMTEAEARSGAYSCEVKKWRFCWNGGHNETVQADFVRESFRIFADKPYVIGATYYCWKDSPRCWQCGQPDCPAETAWGLLDQHGRCKPAYEAIREAARNLNLLEPTELVHS